ncbi:hypothetical protein BOTBODRAFT_37129 [Botryobasidium botryosum FD-172 SS1]|uniref:RING-type domain-containing protein n=1 Tax=Botryobasidium botryosum (strain FD-172 SS1) TaxID=930990 RepID=A0A067M0W9_BOTB1|nr:hypothetical protein BOTBODRAFT_37129 [Botryobasidium botryosum FD-172 SS1]
MAALPSWFHAQFNTLTRPRHIDIAPYLANVDGLNHPAASGSAPIPSGDGAAGHDAQHHKQKKEDTLFGPLVAPAPNAAAEWMPKPTSSSVPAPELVNKWIANGQDGDAARPTTTLQSLVNLKRPTLRLSPLAPHESALSEDALEAHQHTHALEFEFDCDAPKCLVSVHVVQSTSSTVQPKHPSESSTAVTIADQHPDYDAVVVFQSAVDGGFCRQLTLEDGAVLELSRFDPACAAAHQDHPQNPQSRDQHPSTSTPSHPSGTHHPHHSSTRLSRLSFNFSSSTADLDAFRHASRRKLSALTFRRREHTGSVSGPALRVVDGEASPAPAHPHLEDVPLAPSPLANVAGAAADSGTGGADSEAAAATGAGADVANTAGTEEHQEAATTAAGHEHEAKDSDGVRVNIRLEALDDKEQPLDTHNVQVTYLHIVKMGNPPAEGEEDTRHWLVKVVRRDATIGPHTFRLHEIYGLQSASPPTPIPHTDPTHSPTLSPVLASPASPASPGSPKSPTSLLKSTSPTPQVHTNPPHPLEPAPAAPTAINPNPEPPASECVLCLSSPREVLLLPCRHLVACRECAINMIEYGAGGQLMHYDIIAEEGAAASGTVGGAGAGGEGGADGAAGTGAEGASGAGEGPSTGAEGQAAGAHGEAAGNNHTAAAPNEAAAAGEPTPPAPATAPRRRKRRAKGWFCPVCRQPYTSLLRIQAITEVKTTSASSSETDFPLLPTSPDLEKNQPSPLSPHAASPNTPNTPHTPLSASQQARPGTAGSATSPKAGFANMLNAARDLVSAAVSPSSPRPSLMRSLTPRGTAPPSAMRTGTASGAGAGGGGGDGSRPSTRGGLSIRLSAIGLNARSAGEGGAGAGGASRPPTRGTSRPGTRDRVPIPDEE